jgi:hypothetical protein
MSNDPILIASFKAAYGMDTYEGAFAMHLRHIEKDLDARTDRHGNLLPMAIVLMGIGLSIALAGVASNL